MAMETSPSVSANMGSMGAANQIVIDANPASNAGKRPDYFIAREHGRLLLNRATRAGAGARLTDPLAPPPTGIHPSFSAARVNVGVPALQFSRDTLWAYPGINNTRLNLSMAAERIGRTKKGILRTAIPQVFFTLPEERGVRSYGGTSNFPTFSVLGRFFLRLAPSFYETTTKQINYDGLATQANIPKNRPDACHVVRQTESKERNVSGDLFTPRRAGIFTAERMSANQYTLKRFINDQELQDAFRCDRENPLGHLTVMRPEDLLYGDAYTNESKKRRYYRLGLGSYGCLSLGGQMLDFTSSTVEVERIDFYKNTDLENSAQFRLYFSPEVVESKEGFLSCIVGLGGSSSSFKVDNFQYQCDISVPIASLAAAHHGKPFKCRNYGVVKAAMRGKCEVFKHTGDKLIYDEHHLASLCIDGPPSASGVSNEEITHRFSNVRYGAIQWALGFLPDFPGLRFGGASIMGRQNGCGEHIIKKQGTRNEDDGKRRQKAEKSKSTTFDRNTWLPRFDNDVRLLMQRPPESNSFKTSLTVSYTAKKLNMNRLHQEFYSPVANCLQIDRPLVLLPCAQGLGHDHTFEFRFAIHDKDLFCLASTPEDWVLQHEARRAGISYQRDVRPLFDVVRQWGPDGTEHAEARRLCLKRFFDRTRQRGVFFLAALRPEGIDRDRFKRRIEDRSLRTALAVRVGKFLAHSERRSILPSWMHLQGRVCEAVYLSQCLNEVRTAIYGRTGLLLGLPDVVDSEPGLQEMLSTLDKLRENLKRGLDQILATHAPKGLPEPHFLAALWTYLGFGTTQQAWLEHAYSSRHPDLDSVHTIPERKAAVETFLEGLSSILPDPQASATADARDETRRSMLENWCTLRDRHRELLLLREMVASVGLLEGDARIDLDALDQEITQLLERSRALQTAWTTQPQNIARMWSALGRLAILMPKYWGLLWALWRRRPMRPLSPPRPVCAPACLNSWQRGLSELNRPFR